MIDEAVILAIEESVARLLLMCRDPRLSVVDKAQLCGEINGRCFALRVVDPDRYGPDVKFDDAWVDTRGLVLPNDHIIGDDNLLRLAKEHIAA